MARPKKQTVTYFPHYATSGKTLYILENTFGNDGYAFWFKLLELLASTDGHVLDINNTPDWKFLVAKTLVDEETAKKILDMLAELHAIDPELWKGKVIWCQNFVDNVEDVYKKRRAAKPDKPELNNNCDENTNSGDIPVTETIPEDIFPVVSDSENPQSKVKERKVNETKVNEIKTAAASNDVPKPLESENPDNAIANWQKLWLFPNQFQLEDINHLIDEYSDDLVSAAIKIAGSKDVTKGSSINFIEAVLKEWRDNNVTTIDQAREYQRIRSTKFKANNNYGKPTKVEKLPDWANEPQPTEEKEIDEEIQQEFLDRLQRFREGNPS